jgi:hypothetical protein
MRDSKSRPSRMLWSFLSLWAVACLASGTAAANCTAPLPFRGAVPCKLIVQPTDVCASDGSLCAPFNLTNRVGNPDNTDQTKNPIGFVDTTTGKDITRVMLNQFGIDVTYLPVVRYNSPINPATLTTFQTLNVYLATQVPNCPSPTKSDTYTSCDFLTLSQQATSTPPTGIWQGATPTPPRNADPHVLDVYFVLQLYPVNQQGSTLYGFSWIGNNGVAIGKNTFFPTAPLRPRFDNLAHEFLHALGGTHDGFGANGVASNLGSAGAANGTDLRIEPSSPGCSAPSSTNPNGGALYDLKIPGLCPTAPPPPLADQLTLNGLTDSSGRPVASQQDVAVGNTMFNLLGSGLLSNVPNGTVSASNGAGGAVAAASISSTASANPKSNGLFFFDASGPEPPDKLTAIIVMLPKGVRFTSPLNETSTPSRIADWDVANGNNGWARGLCDPATQCLLVEYNQGGLDNQTDDQFTIGVSGDPTGGKVRFIYGPDTFTNVSELTGNVFFSTADSQHPDPGSPAAFLDPTQIPPSASLPCTPVFNGSVMACVKPSDLGISDYPGNEGGQLPSGGGGGGG